ncbi:MAG: amidohydrolase family protein [Dehalococcoidales bacterium]|nr:amidohydrolase family protein [Dehalococcoidales bacterium]
MIIDFHAHVLPPRVKEDRGRYVEIDTAFAQIYSREKVKIATAEDLISSMDRDGVDISVIVNYSWSTHDLCVETNDYILESVARYPKRLIGLCAVSSYTDDASLREIERCARGGVKGVGELRPDTQTLDYTGKNVIKPFTDILQKYKLITLTHASEPVGHLYPGKGAATPGVLYQFIAHFTGMLVVCAHWGGGLPFYTLMPEVRDALKDVYYDTAVSPFLYRPEIYLQVSRLIGADRILYGSDFPVVAQGRIIREINEAGLTEEAKEKILSGNARLLLGI